MKPRIGDVMLGAMLAILLATGAGKADTWITLDFPGAVHTSAHAIEGGLIVGAYSDASSTHGFVYDGSTWTTLDFPGAILTEPTGMDNGSIVGGYIDASHQQHGFMYDGVNWTTVDYPAGRNRWAAGIDGDNIVGQYTTDTRHGFLYDGTTWTTLDFPGAYQTELRDVEGSKIVGTYNFYRGCLYNTNDKTWTMLDFPGVSRTECYGIDSDGNIVGTYSNIHGFLYDGTTWTTLDFPGASITDLFGIDGGRIVGRYLNASGWHGLVYGTNSPPSADAGSDQTVYAGSQLVLDGSGSSDPDGDPLTYTWYLGGQTIATGVNPTIQLPAGLYFIDLVVNDEIEDSQPDRVGLTVVQPIGIDIYPNRVPNRVMLSRNYTLYVAVQGSAGFDVTTLDSATVKFGKIGTEASPVRAPIMRDLNSDGFVDAMYGFQTFDCGFQLGDTEGWLIGFTITGTPAEGVDSVLVSP